jgi:hypothetical protein
MTALGLDSINVAPIADPLDVRQWEALARATNSAMVQSREIAIRLLEAQEEYVRRLALLSFRYRWPIGSDAFDLIVAIATDDLSIENRLAALSLLFVVFVRTEKSASRNAVAEVMRSIGDAPTQAPDISAAARGYLSMMTD